MAHVNGYGHLSGYANNATKRVAFVTLDGHCHELAFEGGAWRHRDLSQATSAPLVAPVYTLVGYDWGWGWNGLGSRQVVFGSSQGSIQELATTADGRWFYNEIMPGAGAPPALPGFAIQGYGWTSGQTKQVIYGAEDGHIHELHYQNSGTWKHDDLTQNANAPDAFIGFPIQGYAWENNVSKQVVYGTRNGHVHHMFYTPGQPWYHVDATAQVVGAPPASTAFPICGFAWNYGGSDQIVYATDDGQIHELNTHGTRSWGYTNLTTATNAPAASSDFPLYGYGWDSGRSKQVVYATADGQIHELAYNGATWSVMNLTTTSRAPAASPSFILRGYAWEEHAKQVIFGTEDGHIHELMSADGHSWTHTDLTLAASAPIAEP